MADDLLPLIGFNLVEDNNNDSDSDSSSSAGNASAPEEHAEDAEGRRGERMNDGGDQRRRTPSLNFDTSLPGTHSYLGDDLEDLRGRTVHEANAKVMLQLLPLPGVVLVPGQVIPLHLFQPQLVTSLSRLCDTHKTFGVVTYSIMDSDYSAGFSGIGCTAELFSMKNETDEASGLGTLRALARGRQRFKVIETCREIGGILLGKVRILPEITIPRCLSDARPQSQNKFACSPREQDDVVKTAVDRQGNILKSVSMVVNKQVDRFSAAYLTHWPPWVYKMYDAELLKEQIIKELHSWNDTLQTTTLPQEAVELSYWVAQNLPLDDHMRMHLMGLSCPVYRLRSELAIMRKCAVLCCVACMQQIARKEDLFSMSAEGPLGAYVNPQGHVHETLTLYKADNLSLLGRPSTEHSWFPGYAWTIAQCRGCANHMGWRFTASKKKMTPQKFWGLCRSSLAPSFRKSPSGTDMETEGAGAGEEEEDLILEG